VKMQSDNGGGERHHEGDKRREFVLDSDTRRRHAGVSVPKLAAKSGGLSKSGRRTPQAPCRRAGHVDKTGVARSRVLAWFGAEMLDGAGNLPFLRAVHPYERSEVTTVFASCRDVAQLGALVVGAALSLFALPSVFAAAKDVPGSRLQAPAHRACGRVLPRPARTMHH